mmetsp:Transcript_38413/g.68879  ORF Transcript_38413/g.68879 Transcript_38413/m.68879 type:complete len:139 (-) Transcript_38413:448-864(-)|eukprot:CAMPEP_0177770450 /NCGR_PEP_ID=MMETSP0491_2-20121128/10935_1 /TAXON_ID=63592 /ORGANISM="Tetraselmis chuii, Strain PLY429" /LENGTH=138 /DNA_ID=CAMNT_0019287673 /DNA_START=231 /DNA_END=647 /DNA_ORIENTATION=-
MGLPQYHEVAERPAKVPRSQTPTQSNDSADERFAGEDAHSETLREEVPDARPSGAEVSRLSGLGALRNKPQLNDEVVLLVDMPWQNLWRGSVGTVAGPHGPGKVEVEFTDRDSGDSFQFLSIQTEYLLVLLHNQQTEY